MSDGATPPFKWLRDTHDWLRIESTAVAALFVFAFIVGPYKRWQTNLAVRFLHTAAAAAAGTMFSQVIGMLNVFDEQAQFYLVWAVFLCVAFDTTVAATAYSIYELSAVRVAFEIGVLANSVDVGVLLGLASFDKFLGPLWALWGFTIAKMLQRVLTFRAAARTYGPENVDLIAHLMSRKLESATVNDYDYRVRGEDKVRYKYEESLSILELVKKEDKSKIVKLDEVSKCKGRLFEVKEEKRLIAMRLKDVCLSFALFKLLRRRFRDDPADEEGQRSTANKEEKRWTAATRLKDVCLSFALFKLLRRRFRDYPAEDEDQRRKAKSLVLEELLKNDSRDHSARTFQVVQVELEFLHDLFYTKYPISFYRGVSVHNILQLLVIATSVWTATWVLTGYYENLSSRDTDAHTWDRNHIDVILTFIFTVIIVLMELWELSNHLLSNWSKVLMTCYYVRYHEILDWFYIHMLVAIVGWCGTLWKPLSKKMGQYSLFHAYKSHSIHRNLFKVFMSFIGEADVGAGAKQSAPANVTEDVQYAIFRALRNEGCCISNGERSLIRNNVATDKSTKFEAGNKEKLEPDMAKSTDASALSEAGKEEKLEPDMAKSTASAISEAGNEEKLEPDMAKSTAASAISEAGNEEKLEPDMAKSTPASAISKASSVKEKISKACNEKDFGRKIMVWHIATSYFELEMAINNNREKKEDGAVEEGGSDPYSHSEVAIRLSRYCAYLLLFAPDLLPVNNLVAKRMFEEVIRGARKFFNKGVKRWHRFLYSCVNLLCGKSMFRQKKEMYDKLKMSVRNQTENVVRNQTKNVVRVVESIMIEVNDQEDAELSIKKIEPDAQKKIVCEGLSLAKDLVDITETEVKEQEDAELSIKKTEPEAQKKIVSEKENGMGIIMAEGLSLAKDLVDITEIEVKESIGKQEDVESIKKKEQLAQEKRWKVLAEFWVEFLLFLAPSDSNAMAHLEMLSNGGEFITHLWALLYNAGILKREGPCACPKIRPQEEALKKVSMDESASASHVASSS